MKIYTKTGDQGQTTLYTGSRIAKDDARVHAYGTLDELNSLLGMVLTHDLPTAVQQSLARIQAEIFELGADLATPLEAEGKKVRRTPEKLVTTLEEEIDMMTERVEPQTHFILPGGTSGAAALHVARTVCRRAERWMVSIKEEINPLALVYVNRLSDWLFVAARLANHDAGLAETKWIPSE